MDAPLKSSTTNLYGDLPGQFRMGESYQYDHWGNITYKQNTGYYHYDSAKNNRLTTVTQYRSGGKVNYRLIYDNNGNVINDGKRHFNYTSFNKPYRITQGTRVTEFSYGANREVYQRIDKRDGQQTKTLMLGGYEQVTLPSGVVEHKFYVGNAVITERDNNTKDVLYLSKDHQGSTTSITNANGSVVQQFVYDPWGKQYTVQSNSIFDVYSSPGISHGYTGHEMVNDMDVIHMNGRTYNPVLGRFMQADPFIQAPGNSQSYNRYAYVLNNPMSYTDPSGYFFSGLRHFVKKYWKVVVAAVVVYVTADAASGWVSTWGATWGTAATATSAATLTTAGSMAMGAMAGAAGGLVGGALMTGSLRGALKGAFTGSIAGAAGGYANFGSVGGWGDAVQRVAVSALGGCGAGKASGGSCSKGAKLAAIAQAVTMGASELYKKVSTKISKATGKQYNETGEPHLWQEGQPDVGKILDERTLERIKAGDIKTPFSSDQSGFMQGVAKGPYMDAFAEFHDGFHDYSFIPGDQLALILTMPPSYAVTIPAAVQPYSDYYYLDLLQDRRN